MPPPVTCANACASVAQAADVVEVEPRRREQVGAVVVLVLEHAADEREAVRVDAGRREADRRRRRRSTREPSITRSRSTMPTHVPAKSSSLVAVDAGQLGRLAADERARPPRGRPRPRPRRARRPARARSGSRRRSRAGTAGRRRVVITSLMQCAARSAPQARSAPRSRATIELRPDESVEAASSRRSSSGWSPAKAPKPVAPVDSTAARSRSTMPSAVASETPAAAYVRSSLTASSLRGRPGV